ncbi:biotin-dependent carboxyltransferase family protein [Halodurantibacterium flavum]|uniref:Biotin-dependent carboxyltransferase family protein n=1 Tax=Halodurantibacterium flavum TaxID=1382802 RepID=A0ABW4S1L1_9RHOB
MIEVLQPGPMVTVQDRGRSGLRHAGVSAAGPMDAPAFALANALAGNAPDAAVLEFAGLAGQFRAHADCRIAVTGGQAELRIGDRPVPVNQSHRVRAGEEFRVGALADAVWGYLAVSGGIATPRVMGSRAAHLRSGLGGGLLRPGDRLPLGDFDAGAPCLTLAHPLTPAPPGAPIRVVLGPQDDRFSPGTLECFLTDGFTVSPRRDRMAMMLDGPPLVAPGGHDIVSDGTVMGAIQVPGSGQPIVLMAESQTTGGYPKIATVIGADLPRLAQMATGAVIRFAAVTQSEAEEIWIAHARALRARLSGLRPRPEGGLSSAWLLSCDLVGGIWPPEEVVW